MLRLVLLILLSLAPSFALAQGKERAAPQGPKAALSQILGRSSDRSVAVSVCSAQELEAYVEYWKSPAAVQKTQSRILKPGVPSDFEIGGLTPNTSYSYRLNTRKPGAVAFEKGDEGRIQTQRHAGGSFTFAVQGDSHPERLGRMFDPALYEITMRHVAKDAPDFYFLMGDDFSIERLIEQGNRSQAAVNAVYAQQRSFLGIVGASTPLMLVNGNHEQAAKYLLDATPNNFAVLAGKARMSYFPLPAPDAFYSGDRTPVEHVGLLRDYYAWEWGDALFVVIDPYWHSDVAVDNEAGTKAPRKDAGRTTKEQGETGKDAKRRARENQSTNQDKNARPDAEQEGNRRGKGGRDLWQITLGDEQYQWLRSTLTQSKAKFKFVFSHHVLGTGRGGIEQAGTFEWGGEDNRGVDRFTQMRPNWQQPIHDLMRDAGVTIFFQGHDHLYARQELDGVIYQSCPNPADPTFTAFNRDAYKTGDIFPNSGYLRVTVQGGADPSVHVEYVRTFRDSDEEDGLTSGMIAHSYRVTPRAAVGAPKK